jgi:hypothetical protein
MELSFQTMGLKPWQDLGKIYANCLAVKQKSQHFWGELWTFLFRIVRRVEQSSHSAGNE